MTHEQAKQTLCILISKYVKSPAEQHRLIEEVNSPSFVSARGVLHQINQSGITIDQEDAPLFKQVGFFFT